MSLQLSTNPARTSKAPPSSQQNRRPTQATQRHRQIVRLRRGSLGNVGPNTVLEWQPGISTLHYDDQTTPNDGGAFGYTNTLGAYVTRDQYAEYSQDIQAGPFSTPPQDPYPVTGNFQGSDNFVLTPDGSKHYTADYVSVQCTGTPNPALCTSFHASNTYPASDSSGFDPYGHDANGILYTGYNGQISGNPITYPNNEGVVTVSDPNGNSIVPSSTGLIDTYGRSIPGTQSGPGFMTFPAYTSSLTLMPGNYSSHDVVPGQPLSAPPSQCPAGTSAAREWNVPASATYNSGSAVYYLCYTYLPFQTAFNALQVVANATGGTVTYPNTIINEASSNSEFGDALMLTAIVLPDHDSYTFQYDQYLSLIQLGLPSGGTISYTWQTIAFVADPGHVSRALQTRTVTPGQGQPPSTTTYHWNITFTNGQAVYPQYSIVTDTNQDDTEYTLGGVDDLGSTWPWSIITGISSYAGCSPHHTNCAAQSGTLMKSQTYGLTQYTNSGNGFLTQKYSPVPYTAPTQITTHVPSTAGMKLSKIVKTLIPAYGPCTIQGYVISKQYTGQMAFQPQPPTTTYSSCFSTAQFGSIATYDFGTSGSGTVGPLLETQTTSYAWQASASVLAANMLKLPSDNVTTGANGSWAAETALCYDMYGNSTSTQRFLGQPSTHSCTTPPSNALVTSSMYTSQGVLSSNTDARGYSTLITAFACNGALPQNVQLPDSTNHFYAYDCNTGKMTSSQDQNEITAGTATTYTYADPLSRLTFVSYPDGGSMSVNYNGDSLPLSMQITTATGETAGPMVTTKNYDGFAREISTQQEVAGSGSGTATVTVATNYDALGRVANVSNPYINLSDSTYGITSYSYDALGRKLYQCEPDNMTPSSSVCIPGNSYQQWAYNGNAVTLTDEVGNQWQKTSDALGRLTQVLEPNGNTKTPSMETDYTFNALNDLLSVTQWGGLSGSPNARVRNFTYDSLSRLITATNPETGTICYGRWSGGNCINGYDANGNLVNKTDARGVITTNSYDWLNRLYATSYSTNDPSVYMQYDLAAAGGSDHYPVGRMTLEWTGPASTAPSYSTGLTSVPAGAYTSTTVLTHDPMGRITSEQQCPFAPCSTSYKFNYSYDLAGNRTSYNNGLPAPGTTALPGLAWTASYDVAGRINEVLTSTQPWTPAAPYPTELVNLASTGTTPAYDPFGHIVEEQASIYPTNSVSPGLTITNSYDKRGRVTSEIGQGQVTASAASQSVGLISVTGTEAAPITVQATPGSTTFSVTGMDATHIVCVNVPAVTLANSQPNVNIPPPPPKCSSVPDSGSLSVTVDGFSSTAVFNGASTDSSIASSIASGFSTNGSPVSAMPNGSSVTITANTTGAATNYAMSFSNLDGFVFSDPNAALTGGQNAGLAYDAGTLTATITNTSVTPNVSYTSSPVTWGQGTVSGSLATSLASAITNAAGSLVTASASGSDIKLISVATGAATNYTVSVNSIDSQSTNFPNPSFSAEAGSLSGGAAAATSDGTVYSYSVPSGGYAPNSNILSQSDSVMGDWNFGYDSLNRLTSGTASNGPYAGLWGCWAYDGFGNRTLQAFQSAGCTTMTPTAQYNANNHVTFVAQGFPSSISAPSGFTYEAGGSGNVIYDGQNHYLYDAEGRLCASETAPKGSMAAYIYDAEGNRVGKGSITSMSCDMTTNGFILTYQYLLGPRGEQVTELDGNGAWLHSNVWAGSHLDATYDTKGLHFHLADPLGTRRVQLNAQGAVEETCQSLPFGDALQCAQSSIVTADDATEHHFTGKERDTESGLDYFGARYYGSSMGRFMSPDPVTVTPARMADPQQLNLYSYVRNNPLVLTDPTGMIISTDDLNDKDKALWQKVVDLANKQDANGNYVNSALHSAYAALDSDSRVFRIEDNPSLGSGTAGQFEITKFNGPNDFSEAKVNLNFNVIKGISSTTQGDFDPSFQKYAGLLGKDGFIPRLAETFGHEASHGVFAINDPAQGANIQHLLNDRDAALGALPAKGRYPLPPDVLQKMDAASRSLVPTEKFAQQQEKIINGELRANPK